MLFLLDRRGGLHELPHEDGATLAESLLRQGIPPTSVLTFRNDDEVVVVDTAPLSADVTYTARLIEGYDIEGVRAALAVPAGNHAPPDDSTCNLLHRRLAIHGDGSLDLEHRILGGADVATHVEGVVGSTIAHYDLAPAGSEVVLGLSGGVDSGTLLMLLAKYRDEHPDNAPRIVSGTFKDFDSQYSETFEQAARLAERHGVEHHVIPADAAERVFHLNRPIAQILMWLMESDDSHLAMYADHHTTRRVLEVFADERGANRIALGLHATDLLGGLINSLSSGHDIGPAPKRAVGPYTYVMPLFAVPKRELHLYYTTRTGNIPKQTTPNQWEFNPGDRNFYYYLADHLQWLWPGIQHWLLTTQDRRRPRAVFNVCENCGASARAIADGTAWLGLCDVCELFGKHGFIDNVT